MKRLLASGIGWSLAWLATTAAAADNVVPPTGAGPSLNSNSASAGPAASLGVSLGQPCTSTIDERPATAAGAIQLAAYTSPGPVPQPTVVRSQSPEPGRFAVPESMANGSLDLAAPPAAGLSDFAAGRSAADPVVSGFAVDAAQYVAPQAQPVAPLGLSSSSPFACGGCSGDGCSCDDGTCCTCDESGIPAHNFYVRAEYLLWWIRAPAFPVLVTTSPPASMGILGMPGTTVLFGGNTVNYNPFSGGRITAGYWLDPCQNTAIEASYFLLGEQTIRFVGNPNEFGVLVRPFTNINTGAQSGEITSFPGVAHGSVFINAPSQLQGGDLNLRCNICCDCNSRLDFIGGFRYLDLKESLTISEGVEVLAAAPPPPAPPILVAGDQGIVVDSFSTRNQFYGGQVGLDYEWQHNRWVIDVRSKLALGVTDESININGYQVITHPGGGVSTFVGGLLALPSNIGHFTRSRFSVVPEETLSLGYRVTDALTLSVGYNFLFWSNVVRPGDQIDTNLDTNQIPNFPKVAPAKQVHPVVLFREKAFFAQGMTFGLQYKY